MSAPLLFLTLFAGLHEAVSRESPLAAAPRLAAKIDAVTQEHWQTNDIKPSAVADDLTFLRRLTLDLVGRIPTAHEAMTFAADRSPDKRSRLIRRLMDSPEYPLQLGRILDDIIQEKFAGDADFLAYLRTATGERRSWDRIFREVLAGPWDSAPRKGADRFLLKRARSLDDLTNDTARVFFGVNVSCAKCHDHPLVHDWTQEHYFGMASFFNPTYEGSKIKGNRMPTAILEKTTDEVSFVTKQGERRTARLMFLSNRVVGETEPTVLTSLAPAKVQKKQAALDSLGRRQQLVKVALEEKAFFSKAIANRIWAYLMGQGLVQPVDQMHSANPPSIPDVLEWLADDFAAHGYNLDRLMAALVSSQMYQRASTKASEGDEPSDRHFARAQLRPLTPRQYALSLVLATGEATYDPAVKPDVVAKRYREMEDQSARLVKLDLLDPRSERYQSSTVEALFLSNQADLQRLMQPAGKNLAARLSAMPDTAKLVETAYWHVFNRPPEAEEAAYLVRWLDDHKADRAKACSEFIWALVTSAEFRFNH